MEFVRPAVPCALSALAVAAVACSGASIGDAKRIGIAISPEAVTLAPAAQQAFTADVVGTADLTVTWAVAEGAAGGTVTAAGVYTAPATLGSYHVVIASVADPSKTAVATVTVSAAGPAGTATVAGAITIPYPTIRSLTVEWPFAGDSNANGVASVRYREAGQTAWRVGMPLRRIPARSNEGFTWTSRHSGSLFDLEPGTTYEIEVTLMDPDGGSTVRTVTATTRPYPTPVANAPIRVATPATLASVLGQTQPGDVVELAAGTYGAFTVTRNGAAGQPVVFRPASGASVTVNGVITLSNRSYVHVQGLTVNGSIRMNNTRFIAIVGNAVRTTADGVTFITRSENNYVADNVITGATAWREASLGASGDNIGEGIQLTGPGHVVEHNTVKGFRDCISFMEEGEAIDQFSIDVLENDLSVCADDGIEADFCFHNCRVARNRITNAFMGVSSQPGLGGPTFIVRNAMYNVVLNAFKLNRGSDGDVILHNTVVKNGDAFSVYSGVTHYRQYARNNLFLGGPGGTFAGYSTGTGKVLALGDADLASQDLDYDAYGSTGGSFAGRVASVTFSTLAELRNRTTEEHAIQIGFDVFASAVAFPGDPTAELAVPDLRIRLGSDAEDGGVFIPNINDGFAGAAPDTGAHEAGIPLPVYGSRVPP